MRILAIAGIAMIAIAIISPYAPRLVGGVFEGAIGVAAIGVVLVVIAGIVTIIRR